MAQYICISVRTLTSSGESADPQKPVEINPREYSVDRLYVPNACACVCGVGWKLASRGVAFSLHPDFPSAPSNVRLQHVNKGSLVSLCLSWEVPCNQRKTGNVSIVSYSIFLNQDLLVKTVPVAELVHPEEEEKRVSVELVKEDFADIGQLSVDHNSGECVLSIRSCEEYYTSEHSPVVVIPNDAVRELLPAAKQSFSLLTSGSLGHSFGRTKGDTPVMTNGISGNFLDANHTNAAGGDQVDEGDSDEEEITEGMPHLT